MALNSSNLAARCEAKVRHRLELGDTPYPELTKFLTAISEAVVEEFVASAEINGGKANGATLAGKGIYLVEDDVTVGPMQINDIPVTGGIR